jgi:hypothetical protein
MPTNPTPALSNRAKRMANMLDALTFVAHFGHLTAAQIGGFLWPKAPAKTQRDLAHKLLASLLSDELLLVRNRVSSSGQPVRAFTLSAAGVQALNRVRDLPWARPGHSVLRQGFGHAALTFTHDALVAKLQQYPRPPWDLFGPVMLRRMASQLRPAFGDNTQHLCAAACSTSSTGLRTWELFTYTPNSLPGVADRFLAMERQARARNYRLLPVGTPEVEARLLAKLNKKPLQL